MLKRLRSFFASWPVAVVVTPESIVLTSPREDGATRVRSFHVPVVAQPWYLCADYVVEVFDDRVVRLLISSGDGETPLVLFEGTQAQCKKVADALRRELSACQHGYGREGVVVQHAGMASLGRGLPSGRGWLAWFGVAAVAAFAIWSAQYFLRLSNAGSVDLTGMTVEQVAAIDSNPAAVHALQDRMLEAVQAGRDKAKEMTGRIEKDHLDALGRMNINVGVAAKNAASCLGQ